MFGMAAGVSLLINPKETHMTDIPESTLELLSRLLGKRTAKRVYRGSLTDLFLDEDVPAEVQSRLQASRELVQRWMLEDLRRLPVLQNPRAVRDYLAVHYAGHEREAFGCLFLDNRHRLIAVEEMFLGTIDGASVHPREVVKRALKLNAAAVILAHNHPSGVAEPSQADELITVRIRDALALVDIRVLDHVVVGAGQVVSFAERGLI
jgi:DNA repair protein RadC